jgi:hypothetical protein
MRVKGFLLTIDALFALLAVAVAFSVVFIFSNSPVSFQKQSALRDLGRDFLIFNSSGLINENSFESLTGLNVSTDLGRKPLDSASVVASVFYKYPALCGCTFSPCTVGFGNECFNRQDSLLVNNFTKRAWVSVK